MPASLSPASLGHVHTRRAVFAGLLIFGYFAVWALLRPPLQTPDEPQHLLKANSILLQPWKSAPGVFDLDPRFVNPLALDTPAAIDKLFFRSFNAMSRDDIAMAQGVRWPNPSKQRPLEPYARAIASYPPLYYLAVFSIAEPLVRVGGLSPYQATFAYRLVTAALAAMLWTLVWVMLRQTPETSGMADLLVAFALLNPMLAFISSGVTPDAVNNPLCNLAILLLWRVASLGTGYVMAFVVLVVAALTKPSGLQLAGIAAGVLVLLAILGQLDRRRAVTAAGVAVAAAVVSVVVFYAWSPPRFMAGGPSSDSLPQFVVARLHNAELAWEMFWGRLGWTDYGLRPFWYRALLAVVGVNAALIIVRPRRPARVAWYLGLVTVAFVAVTFAGEYHYLAVAGYTFQGRYLLPVAIGVGVVLWHEVVPMQRALLVSVLIINLLLVRETTRRYYVDGWQGAWQALPIHGLRQTPLEGDTP